jgi:hypothetical protein
MTSMITSAQERASCSYFLEALLNAFVTVLGAVLEGLLALGCSPRPSQTGLATLAPTGCALVAGDGLRHLFHVWRSAQRSLFVSQTW